MQFWRSRIFPTCTKAIGKLTPLTHISLRLGVEVPARDVTFPTTSMSPPFVNSHCMWEHIPFPMSIITFQIFKDFTIYAISNQ